MGESENGEEERRTCLLLLLEAEAWIENGPQEEVAAPSSSSLLFLLLSHRHIWFDIHSWFKIPQKSRFTTFRRSFTFTPKNDNTKNLCNLIFGAKIQIFKELEMHFFVLKIQVYWYKIKTENTVRMRVEEGTLFSIFSTQENILMCQFCICCQLPFKMSTEEKRKVNF